MNIILGLMIILAMSTNDADLIRPNEHELSMIFIGDIMCHDGQFISSKVGDNYDFRPWFEYVKPIISSADLAMANLETTLNNRGHYSGYPRFRTPQSLANAIKDAGIDILSTANNHSLDDDQIGVEYTLDYLRENNIYTVGTCKEGETNRPLILEKNGIKIGIICSTYGTNGLKLPADKSYMVNINDQVNFDEQVAYLKKYDVDGILCFIHWGYEYNRNHSQEQENYANTLFEKGINWIIGSHPHVIQEAVFNEDTNNYVMYSLGNFISGQTDRYKDTGLMAKLNFKKIGDEPLKLISTEYFPTWVDHKDENGKLNYCIFPIEYQGEFPARVSDADKNRMSQALNDFKSLYNLK